MSADVILELILFYCECNFARSGQFARTIIFARVKFCPHAPRPFSLDQIYGDLTYNIFNSVESNKNRFYKKDINSKYIIRQIQSLLYTTQYMATPLW